jgi:hypothetical protein
MHGLAVFLVCFLFLSLPCASSLEQSFAPSESPVQDALWIELSKETVSNPGDTFNATVWINATETVYAWQTEVFFNTTHFDISRAGYTAGSRSAFFSQYQTICVSPIINPETGSVLFGESLLGNAERAPGHGSLVWIEFELKDASFQDNLSLEISMSYGTGTFILSQFLETIPYNTVENASITLQHETTSSTTPTTTITPPPTPFELVAVIATISLVAVAAIIILRRRRAN